MPPLRVRTISVAVLIVLVMTTHSFATDPLPWRLDLSSRMQRRAAHERTASAERVEGRQATPISGAVTPDLLLPWELHGFLLSTAFYKDERVASKWRERFAARSNFARGNPNFWSVLDRESTAFLQNERKSEELVTRMQTSGSAERQALHQQIVAFDASRCRLRARALQQAMQAYGGENFMRFLYEAVAPDMQVVPTTPFSPERHELISRGCE